MQAQRGSTVRAVLYLASVLDWGERSTSRPGHFTPRRSTRYTLYVIRPVATYLPDYTASHVRTLWLVLLLWVTNSLVVSTKIAYKNSGRTAQWTQSINVTSTNNLLLYMKVMSNYCETNSKHVTSLCFLNVGFLVWNLVVYNYLPTLMQNSLFINKCMLHYYPRHVSSINMPIFRRKNFIHAASGIVTLCKRLYSRPVESGLQNSSLSTSVLYSRLQRVTIPDAVWMQFFLLKMGMLMLETCQG